MRLSEVGEQEASDLHPHLLNPDWHKRLTEDQLAAYVRYQFINVSENSVHWDAAAHARKRPHWDGGTDLYGVRRSNIWAQIARDTRKYGAEPGMWVHAHFSPAAELKLNPNTLSLPEIKPTNLQSKQSPQIYMKYRADLPTMIEHKFDLAGRTISMRFNTTASLGLSKEDQTLYVLCDETYVTASPFFRHAFAAAANCEDAVAQYLFSAAVDYDVHQCVYDSLIAQTGERWWLTDTLKQLVVDIRQHWEGFYG
jgi:hypothetical protein